MLTGSFYNIYQYQASHCTPGTNAICQLGFNKIIYFIRFKNKNNEDLNSWGLPRGSLVKNPPANAGDMGSIPGPG